MTNLLPKQQNAAARCGLYGQDELTRPSQSVLFNKDGDWQVAGFGEKLTRCQPITNTVSRLNSWT
jgi:hypothetical protein